MRTATYLSACTMLISTIAVAQSVTYDHDRAVDFSRFKTYAWTRGTELTDELNHARVVRAIEATFLTKGLARVEPSAGPDVLVAYHANALVWRSLASSDIQPSDKPDTREKKITKAAEKMFKNFPPPSR